MKTVFSFFAFLQPQMNTMNIRLEQPQEYREAENLTREAKRIMQSERLVLRPWMESDAADLYKYASDPEVGGDRPVRVMKLRWCGSRSE